MPFMFGSMMMRTTSEAGGSGNGMFTPTTPQIKAEVMQPEVGTSMSWTPQEKEQLWDVAMSTLLTPSKEQSFSAATAEWFSHLSSPQKNGGTIDRSALDSTMTTAAKPRGQTTCRRARNEQRSLPPGSGVILAMRDASEYTREAWESGEIRRWSERFATQVFLPVLAMVLISLVLYWIGQRLYLKFFPPSAVQLHQQALAELQSGHRQTTTQSRAERLWNQALERDPCYDSAWVSLAALYLYRQGNPSKALDLLQRRQSLQSKGPKMSPELEAIRADALALQQGHADMLQPDLKELEYLTFLATLPSANRKNYSKPK